MLKDNTQKELHQKIYVKSLFQGADNKIKIFPSLAQCVGTKRLWSSRLGEAFWCDREKKEDVFILEKVAYLSRTYLVIDDFIKDESIDDETRDLGKNWLNNISDKIKRNIDCAGGDPEEFTEQLKICISAFNKRNAGIPIDIINNSIEKCEIFFNPYKLYSVPLDDKIRKKRIEFLEGFFSVCQVLDDFCDIAEDLLKENNHNLFMNLISSPDYHRVLEIRRHIAPSLLQSAQDFLVSRFDDTSSDSNAIFRHFFCHSIEWIKWKKETLKIYGDYKYRSFDYRQWLFDIGEVEYYERLASISDVSGVINDIRPEFMQAYFSGVTKIVDFE